MSFECFRNGKKIQFDGSDVWADKDSTPYMDLMRGMGLLTPLSENNKIRELQIKFRIEIIEGSPFFKSANQSGKDEILDIARGLNPTKKIT